MNDDGSVTAKDLQSAVPLQLPVTSGDPRATSNISLGVNVPAAAEVVTDHPQFADGYNLIHLIQAPLQIRHQLQSSMIWETQQSQPFILLKLKRLQQLTQQINMTHGWLSMTR